MTVTDTPIHLLIGPHRSGTSLLGQILCLLGMDIGRSVMLPSFDNPRGFWENQKVIHAHDGLLSALGADWTTVDKLTPEWISSEVAHETGNALVDILEKDFDTERPALVKDPRLCVLLPLWQEISKTTNRPLKLLGIVRFPGAISNSLAARSNLLEGAADHITQLYLQAFFKSLKPMQPAFVVFEKLIETPAKDVIDVLLNELNLPQGFERRHAEHVLTRLMSTNVSQRYKNNEDMKPYRQLMGKKVLLGSWPGLGKYLKDCPHHPLPEGPEGSVTELSSLLLKTNTVNTDGVTAERRSRPDELQIMSEKLDVLAAREAHLTGELDSANQRLKDIEVQCAKFRDLAVIHFSQLEFEKSENLRKEAHLTGELDSANQRLKDIEVQCAKFRDLAVIHFSQLEFEKSENLRKEAQCAEYRDLAETHFSQLEFEKSRFLRMEKNMSSAISIMRKRLHYSRSEPVRTAVKTISLDAFRSLFRALPLPDERHAFQSLRRALPLPTGMRLLITRKMAGFAAQLDIYNTLGLIPESMPLTAVPWRGNNIDFAFLEEDHPVISIIVPVYNEIGQTISCLRSIHFQMVNVPYEVILADDHSPDESHTIFKEISGLRYFRNPENLGFLRNCNVNAARARGDYIVFLNNDTYVKQGWLQSLYSTYFEHGDVGIVGSKLIYPSGELQEAGGIVWEDASGWNWGRLQDPNHPRYNFVRDVDYVSGASLMIRTDLFREIGGFYEDLEKAYYEDTDCCFRVRERGYRVLYQPMSEVIHIESLSSGPDINTGMKRYQDINKDIFYNTWKDQLATHLPNAQSPEIASDRNVSGHILYVDSVTPEPDKDSGSLDAVNAFHILRGLGYRVHFVPGTNFAHWDTATKTLQKMGVECIYYPHYPNMKDLLKERGDTFDYIILSRLEIMQLFLKDVKRYCPSAKLIFNTVDLHHLRMERESVLLDDEKALKLARDVKKQELGFIKKSDATIVLSEHEKRLLSQNIDIKNKLFTIPLIRQKTSRLAHYNETRDIVFLGGYRHAPNVDAVDWMMKELWPVMQKTLPDVRLLICGSHIPERFQEYASGTVMVKGYIENLDALLSCTRLTLAPLRYGAGLKGKVATSIGAGVPCVGTEIAYEGMPTPGLDIVRLQAGNAKEFSELATKVYFDPDQWEKISIAGVKYHNENFSMDAVTPAYENMLNAIAD